MYSNKILLANGEIKKAENITLNDSLLNIKNDSIPFLGTELIEQTNIYKITTKAGTEFYVDEDGTVPVYRNKEIKDIPISDICNLDEITIRNKSYRLYRLSKVEFDNEDELPIKPYLFGLMLLNLSSFSGGVKMTISSEFVKEELQPFLDENDLEARAILQGVNNSYQIVKKHKSRNKNPLYQILEDLGLADVITNNRFIPNIYKTANVANRYALLAAICDYSGCINGKGYQVTTSSIKFAEDIIFIAKTLGLNAKFSKVIKNKKPYCNIYIGGDAYKIPCLIKKIETNNTVRTDFVTRNFKIEYLGVGDFLKVITTDRYLLDDCTIVT